MELIAALILVNMRFSKIFDRLDKIAIGRWFAISHAEPFLNIGLIFEILNLVGNLLVRIHKLKRLAMCIEKKKVSRV